MKKKLFEEWEKEVYQKALDHKPERKKTFTNSSGFMLDPVYTDMDVRADTGEELPGAVPYTRGIRPTMYRGRFWTMRQYSGFGTAEDTNKRFRYLISEGQTGLSTAFDLPTQMGYDSDHSMAAGEVGKTGVAIDSLEDMEILFREIDIGSVSTSMTINATAPILFALYVAVARKQGVKVECIRGTLQNDILKEYIARGTYIYPPEPSLRLATDIFEYAGKHAPLWNTISISGYHIREAGSTAVQELAFTMADAITYVEVAVRRGLNVDDFASRLSFFFNAHNDFFEEVAKFRAARRIWARVMKERFHARKEKSLQLRFHTQTGGSTLTAQQPDNNVIRVTLQALAAVLGGTQSLHTNSKDEALALPTESSARLALRTQQIIAEESNVTSVVDPLGGSYYVESLTVRVEEAVNTYLDRIEKMGGTVRAIETGYIQNEIQESAYKTQKKIERGDIRVVGVNSYISDTGDEPEIFKRPAGVEKRQVEKLKRLKERRDTKGVQETLHKLKIAAEGNDNLIPFILDAVESYTTLGEISDVFRGVFGEYHENLF